MKEAGLKRPYDSTDLLYHSIYVAFWKKQNYKDRLQISDRQGLKTEGGNAYKEAWGTILR